MAEYIEKEETIQRYQNVVDIVGIAKSADGETNFGLVKDLDVIEFLQALPAADVREVVLCGECYLHTHCRTEDVFDFAGLREDNRFCSVGKRKTNIAKMGGAEDG